MVAVQLCLKMHSQVTCNYDYHDHDADDVKNVHCPLRRRHARPQLEDEVFHDERGDVDKATSEQNSSLSWPYFTHGKCRSPARGITRVL